MLWRGPYTIIDKAGPVTYKIQLIGSQKTLVVHRNRLKLCYGEPQGKASKKQPTPAPRNRESETACPLNKTSPPATSTSELTYAEVVANQQDTRSVGGYTTSSDEQPSIGTERPQRNRHPPVRYGNYYTH